MNNLSRLNFLRQVEVSGRLIWLAIVLTCAVCATGVLLSWAVAASVVLLAGVVGGLAFSKRFRLVWWIPLASGAFPDFVPLNFDVGVTTVTASEISLAITLALLLVSFRSTRARLAVGFIGVFVAAVFWGLGVGLIKGYPVADVVRDIRPTVQFLAAIIVGVAIVRAGYLHLAVRIVQWTLIVASVVTLGAAVFGYGITGRADSTALYSEAGALVSDADSTRYLTSASLGAAIYLAACLGGIGSGRRLGRLGSICIAASLALAFLSYSRYQVIAIAVGVGVGAVMLISARGRGALRGLGFGMVVVSTFFVVGWLAYQYSLLPESISDSLTSFQSRVIDGLSPSVAAVDSSAQDRVIENTYALQAIGGHPLVGSGFGFPYKPARYGIGLFAEDAGRFYAHDYYTWIWMKTGLLGLLGFAALVAVGAVRQWRARLFPLAPSLLAAVLAVGAVSFVAPLANSAGNAALAGLVMCFGLVVDLRTGSSTIEGRTGSQLVTTRS